MLPQFSDGELVGLGNRLESATRIGLVLLDPVVGGEHAAQDRRLHDGGLGDTDTWMPLRHLVDPLRYVLSNRCGRLDERVQVDDDREATSSVNAVELLDESVEGAHRDLRG